MIRMIIDRFTLPREGYLDQSLFTLIFHFRDLDASYQLSPTALIRTWPINFEILGIVNRRQQISKNR